MLWQLVKKDFLLMIRDRKALLITLLMPAILTTILGMSIGKLLLGQEVSMEPAAIAVVNLDDRRADLEKIANLLNGEMFKEHLDAEEKAQVLKFAGEMDLEKILYHDLLEQHDVQKFIRYELTARQEAEERLNRGELTAVVIIPEDFLYNIFVNMCLPFRNQTALQIIKNPDQTLKSGIVEDIFSGFTDAISSAIIAKNAFLEVAVENSAGTWAYGELEQLTRQVLAVNSRGVEIESLDVAGRRRIGGFEYYAGAMATMFILFSAGYGARYLNGERATKTYYRMLLGNISRPLMLTSRFIASSIFVFVQILLLALLSSLLFKAWWGEPVDLIPYVMMVSATVGALTVLLASLNLLVNDDRAATFFEMAVIQVLSLLGGSFFPLQMLPEIFGRMGAFTPNGAALNGFLKLMQGYHLSELSGNMVMLLAIACVFLLAGVVLAQAVKEG